MKKQLLRMINEVHKNGIDISKTPPLFVWSYEEYPYYEFHLMVKMKNINELPEEDTVH